MQLPTKSFIEYSWEDNCLNIGKIVFGSVRQEPYDKNSWYGQVLVTLTSSESFSSRKEAEHWLVDQMLTWLYKAGVISLK